MVNRVSDRIR